MMIQKFLKATAICLLLLLTQLAFGQNNTVSGKVTDQSNGNGLPGVTVSGKGSSAATQTSNDGSFSINVPNSVTILVFTSIGYASQEATISGNTVNVSL